MFSISLTAEYKQESNIGGSLSISFNFNDSSMLTKIRMESPPPLLEDDIDVCLHCQSLSAPDGFPANCVAHCAAPRFDSSSQQPPVAEYLDT